MKHLNYAADYTDFLKRGITVKNVCKLKNGGLMIFREKNNGSESEGYEESDITLLQGTWNITDSTTSENYGTITFTSENFSMSTTKGNIVVGDFGMSPTKPSTLALSWAQGDDGTNKLTNNGYECKYGYINSSKFTITNLPFFENNTIVITKA